MTSNATLLFSLCYTNKDFAFSSVFPPRFKQRDREREREREFAAVAATCKALVRLFVIQTSVQFIRVI